MKYLVLALLFIVSCTPAPVVQETTIETPTGPTTRETEVLQEEPVQEIVANDEGFETWEEWKAQSGVGLLVSDGEKAARLYIPQGKSVELPMNTPVTVTIVAISTDEKVVLEVNGERTTLELEEDEFFEDGRIIVFVDTITIK